MEENEIKIHSGITTFVIGLLLVIVALFLFILGLSNMINNTSIPAVTEIVLGIILFIVWLFIVIKGKETKVYSGITMIILDILLIIIALFLFIFGTKLSGGYFLARNSRN